MKLECIIVEPNPETAKIGSFIGTYHYVQFTGTQKLWVPDSSVFWESGAKKDVILSRIKTHLPILIKSKFSSTHPFLIKEYREACVQANRTPE